MTIQLIFSLKLGLVEHTVFLEINSKFALFSNECPTVVEQKQLLSQNALRPAIFSLGSNT